MSTNINSVIFFQSGIYLSIDAQVTGGCVEAGEVTGGNDAAANTVQYISCY